MAAAPIGVRNAAKLGPRGCKVENANTRYNGNVPNSMIREQPTSTNRPIYGTDFLGISKEGDMKQIWKAELHHGANQVPMPEGAFVMSAKEQAGNLFVWFEGAPKHDLLERTVWVVGTGEDIGPEITLSHYVGTVVMADGFVWHVYEEGGVKRNRCS